MDLFSIVLLAGVSLLGLILVLIALARFTPVFKSCYSEV